MIYGDMLAIAELLPALGTGVTVTLPPGICKCVVQAKHSLLILYLVLKLLCIQRDMASPNSFFYASTYS